jgi:hypothetical protein
LTNNNQTTKKQIAIRELAAYIRSVFASFPANSTPIASPSTISLESDIIDASKRETWQVREAEFDLIERMLLSQGEGNHTN